MSYLAGFCTFMEMYRFYSYLYWSVTLVVWCVKRSSSSRNIGFLFCGETFLVLLFQEPIQLEYIKGQFIWLKRICWMCCVTMIQRRFTVLQPRPYENATPHHFLIVHGKTLPIWCWETNPCAAAVGAVETFKIPKGEASTIIWATSKAECCVKCIFLDVNISLTCRILSNGEDMRIRFLTCHTRGSSSVMVLARQILRVTVCEKQVMPLAIIAPLMEKGSMV